MSRMIAFPMPSSNGPVSNDSWVFFGPPLGPRPGPWHSDCWPVTFDRMTPGQSNVGIEPADQRVWQSIRASMPVGGFVFAFSSLQSPERREAQEGEADKRREMKGYRHRQSSRVSWCLCLCDLCLFRGSSMCIGQKKKELFRCPAGGDTKECGVF